MATEILSHFRVPTGDILVIAGERGRLELVSIGNYGKEVNLNSKRPVCDGTPLLSLQRKWVVLLSSQYGCSMNCLFCDVPKVGPGRNVSLEDLRRMLGCALALHPEVTGCERLNVHYARMGEPTFNPWVLAHAQEMSLTLSDYGPHPVLTTMMPRHNRALRAFIEGWVQLKNEIYNGEAGLQISLTTTSEPERDRLFQGNACSLAEIARVMQDCPPVGRKYILNFPIGDLSIDAETLRRHFDPDWFAVKLTAMHMTDSARENGLRTAGDSTDPAVYTSVRASLEAAGYQVLVFIDSQDEDLGRITGGHVVLAGRPPDRQREGPLVFR